MTQPLSFLARITLAPDGGLVIEAWENNAVAAEKRFAPAQALAIKDWLKSPKTWDKDNLKPHPFRHSQSLSLTYSHESGKLRAFRFLSLKAQQFDPNKDEDLAKLVRLAKSLAEKPVRSPKEEIAELPSVTAEDLATKRQVFKEAQAAAGAKKPKKRKPALVVKSKADAEASALLDSLLLGA